MRIASFIEIMLLSLILKQQYIFSRGWVVGRKHMIAYPQQQQQRKVSTLLKDTKRTTSCFEYTNEFQDHPDVKRTAPNHREISKPYFPIFYNDVYEVNLPKGHRFPMEKYRKVREIVQQHYDIEEAKELSSKIMHQFCVSPLATWDELITTHSPEYISRFLQGDQTESELRNVGFPWSIEGVKRALSSTGGTVAAACAVCDVLLHHHSNKQEESSSINDEYYPICWSAHVAGGTHHAFYDRGEGFCIFSDIAVAANVIRQKYGSIIRKILIIDLDVHQGNGNAVLFQNRQDIVTFSLHCQGNYFSKKEISDLDIELPVGCTDETYLVTLRHWLKQIKQESQGIDFVFFQAGVDILKKDRLGKMALTAEGVKRRNKLVYDFCSEQRLPLVITMGGGYPSNNDWTPILKAHANVYIQAYEYLEDLQRKREMLLSDSH